MKVFVENISCDLKIRIHFEAVKSFPVAYIENIFVFEGYFDLTHSGSNIRFSPDGNSYILPLPLGSEIELTVSGKELYLENDAVGAKQLAIVAYAMEHSIRVEVLKHKNADFVLNNRVLPKTKKAMQSAALHLEIAKQASG